METYRITTLCQSFLFNSTPQEMAKVDSELADFLSEGWKVLSSVTTIIPENGNPGNSEMVYVQRVFTLGKAI